MNLREAAQQALEALEKEPSDFSDWLRTMKAARTALRAALAEEKNENTVQSTGGVHSRVSDGADRNVEAVTDCHDLEQARAVAISNLLAHFGITSANSDVNAVYLHKLLGDFLTAAIGCKKEGDKLSPPLEVEECGYPNCLSTNGCEKQCPAFPRIPDADTGKTSDHFADANKMVATCRDSRLVEPVATINEMETVEPVAWMVYTLDGKSAFITDNPEDFTPEHKSLPLYTAPPKREPLTAPQIYELDWPDDVAFGEILEFTRAIERAHGIGGEE